MDNLRQTHQQHISNTLATHQQHIGTPFIKEAKGFRVSLSVSLLATHRNTLHRHGQPQAATLATHQQHISNTLATPFIGIDNLRQIRITENICQYARALNFENFFFSLKICTAICQGANVCDVLFLFTFVTFCLLLRLALYVCHMRRRIHVSYEEEDTCVI